MVTARRAAVAEWRRRVVEQVAAEPEEHAEAIADEVAEMLCKRMAIHVKRAKAELEEIRALQRATSERLKGTLPVDRPNYVEDLVTTVKELR